MKKTFKRMFVLIAIITVLCAFAVTASAEDACHGDSTTWIPEYTAPTCTEDGYTSYYCPQCGELANKFTNESRDKATGHSYLAVEYKANGDGYTRVVKCQNPVCKRATENVAAVTGKTVSCPTKYYLVEFKNKYASPSLGDVTNHSDYFLEGYYVESVPSTWVVDLKDGVSTYDYFTKKYAPISRVNNKPNVDADGAPVTEPSYEYFEEADGTINLYVKNGEKAYADGKSVFVNTPPVRNNDTNTTEANEFDGVYEFNKWVADDNDNTDISEKVITANTTFLATFTAKQNYTVSYTFKDGNGDTIFKSVNGVPYGSLAQYDGEEPTKAASAKSHFKFAGWRVEDKKATDTDNFIPLNDYIPLYHNHVVIYAQYEEIYNRYDFELVDYAGNPFKYANGENIVKEDVAFYEEIVSEDIIAGLDISRPNTEKYTFAQTKSWKIAAVNGYIVDGTVSISLKEPILPETITVKNDAGETITIGYEEYGMISLSPYYKSQFRIYPITVSIMHNYFLEEDLFDNTRPRSDILDDFYVTVYDSNNLVLGTGAVNSEGKVTLYIPYSDLWRFEAVTYNSKYFGSTTVSPMAYDAEYDTQIYNIIDKKGVDIAPRLSEGWASGEEQHCNCVCHSFLGGFFLRVYNLIYRIFGYEYVCCPDLFATHGDVLLYGNN